MVKRMIKSGFVAIVGRPNVGKSTLLNAILKRKVAIISNKAQTTRNNIQGIYNSNNAQIIFIDTPGIHKPKSGLSKFMNKSAYASMNDVDIILFLLNANQDISTGDLKIIDALKNRSAKKIVVLNKIDLISKEALIKKLTYINENFSDIFEDIIPISALEYNNINTLIDVIVDKLNDGFKYFPDDMVSDHDDKFLTKEVIREKILQLTYDEIPHSVAIDLEKFIFTKDNNLIVSAIIIVEKSSQKGIIIGKNGANLKEVGIRARNELEKIFGCKIYLDLFVKVENNWREKQFQLDELGYTDKDY
ncbi:MAG: GTPase Era [Bacilli bacterium]|nr:GTPase Era [Bacilli bacterium]